MFHADVPKIEYRDPWAVPLVDRIAALARKAAYRVAYLCEAPESSSFRYRVHNMVEALALEPTIAAAWFTREEVPALLPLIDRCDALVACRTRYCEQVAHLIGRAQDCRVLTIFDCDDLVFDPAYAHLVVQTLGAPLIPQTWDHWFAVIGRLHATLRLCERAIVTNDFLARRLHACAPGITVRVAPNFLNAAQLSVSARLIAAKRRSGFARDGRIHLGYFSGSPTHARDFVVVAEALAALLRADRRVTLLLAGHLQAEGALADLTGRIERLPMQDFLNLQRAIASVEFNLAPLQYNDFTNCKSELKYFEAAIAGTLTLASPTHAFREAIRDGETGWLVPETDWDAALAAAIAALGAYPEMAERAHADAEARYSPQAMLPAICAAIGATRDQDQSRRSAPSLPSTGSDSGGATAAMRRSTAA